MSNKRTFYGLKFDFALFEAKINARIDDIDESE